MNAPSAVSYMRFAAHGWMRCPGVFIVARPLGGRGLLGLPLQALGAVSGGGAYSSVVRGGPNAYRTWGSRQPLWSEIVASRTKGDGEAITSGLPTSVEWDEQASWQPCCGALGVPPPRAIDHSYWRE